jgi:hypothetical protein
MRSEYELRDHLLFMMRNDVQISMTLKEAIHLRQRDRLTDLVQTVATDMSAIPQNEKTIHSVVDWLIDLFG